MNDSVKKRNKTNKQKLKSWVLSHSVCSVCKTTGGGWENKTHILSPFVVIDQVELKARWQTARAKAPAMEVGGF